MGLLRGTASLSFAIISTRPSWGLLAAPSPHKASLWIFPELWVLRRASPSLGWHTRPQHHSTRPRPAPPQGASPPAAPASSARSFWACLSRVSAPTPAARASRGRLAGARGRGAHGVGGMPAPLFPGCLPPAAPTELPPPLPAGPGGGSRRALQQLPSGERSVAQRGAARTCALPLHPPSRPPAAHHHLRTHTTHTPHTPPPHAHPHPPP
jgi:hypothetical protein